MRITTLLAPAILLLSLAAAPLHAQEDATVILRTGEELEGDILSIDADSLCLNVVTTVYYPRKKELFERRAIPVADIRRVETESQATFGGRFFTGFGIGLLGGILGAAVTPRGSGMFAGLGQALVLIGAVTLGTVVGLVSGIAAESSRGEGVYDPSLDHDLLALRGLTGDRSGNGPALSPSGEGAPGSGAVPSSPTAFDSRCAWNIAEDSLPRLWISLSTGAEFYGYLYSVDATGITVLSNDRTFERIFDEASSGSISFVDIRRIAHSSGSSIPLWSLIGGMLTPILISTDDADSYGTLKEIGIGAAFGAGIGALIDRGNTDSWEWHPQSGNPEFLRQYSIMGVLERESRAGSGSITAKP